MNIDTQRILDRLLGVPLCALLSGIERLRPRAAAQAPRAIAVVLLSEMGSMVCAQPMLRRLRERHPQAALYVLVLERNRAAIDLLGLVPAEQIVTIDDRSLTRFVGGSFRALRRLRAARIDVVIDCELFARISAIYAYLSGARLRVGFHRHTQEGLYRGSLINRPVLYNPYTHIGAQFLTLAAALDSQSMPPGKETLVPERLELVPLAFAPEELESATQRLESRFPSLRGRRLVLVYPGFGPLPIRAWPPAYFEQLCAALIADQYAVAVIGLAADRPLAQQLIAAVGSAHCLDLTGYTATLRELLALCHRAALLIANDGGPGHFAALTPVPILSFFGPETPLLYGPLSPRAVSLYRRLPCAPCLSAYNHRRTPCDGDNQCLKQLSVAEALGAARRLLAAGPLQ
jgi:ADP-heptose:LPS heptosyltransferase